jgi:tRNA (cytidine/uridine-2'-O-)-methyltransferase
MSLNIVLLEPEIPNNTGNIGRLSLASGSSLHLIKPLGFDIDDSRVKRAGLDYWKHIDLYIHESWEAFVDKYPNAELAFMSSHGKKDFYSIDFKEDMFLVFGKESVGLPKELLSNYTDKTFKIPMHSPHIRSLNIANSVGIVVFEGLRQLAIKL